VGDTGIFISMRPQQARLLLPQLQIAQVNLPIFATSHVYGGSDDVGANRDLDGLEFCDAPWLFDAQPGLPNRSDIAARLPAARGSAARLFAFGMDAWNGCAPIPAATCPVPVASSPPTSSAASAAC
jgi:outer membrane PBP1 activator LpoA protein